MLKLVERTIEVEGFREAQSDMLSTPEEVFNYAFCLDLQIKDREHFVILHLDSRNRVTGHETVSIGSLNASIVHPREVFKGAILVSAASIICLHNHPSGDLTPSREDITMTNRLKEAGDLLGIEVLDHLIVSHEGFISFKDKGLL